MLSNLHGIETYIGSSCYTAILTTLSCVSYSVLGTAVAQSYTATRYRRFSRSTSLASCVITVCVRREAQSLSFDRPSPGCRSSRTDSICLDYSMASGSRGTSSSASTCCRSCASSRPSCDLASCTRRSERSTLACSRFSWCFSTSASAPLPTVENLESTTRSFPDFLATYAPALVSATPVSCTQLINIFVSAFPSQIKLPDPFGEHTDLLPDMSKLPPVAPNAMATVSLPTELQAALDKVASGEAQASQLAGLGHRFALPENAVADLRYNYVLIDLVVQHLCSAAVGSGKTTFSAVSPSVAIFELLLSELDLEGRYLLVCAAANLLRWPSAHTRWAKHLLMHVYAVRELESQEVVTRVLLERCAALSTPDISRC